AEDDVVAAQEVARIDGAGLQGHFRAFAQDLCAINDHHGQQHDLKQGGNAEQRELRDTPEKRSEGCGGGFDHWLVLGSRRLSTVASATAAAPATARNAERRSSEPFTAQVIPAMTPAIPSQPATIRARAPSSMPETTRQSMAQSSKA